MNRRGFTLMEVIVYVGLFGILMTGAVVSAYQLLKEGDRNEVAVAVQEEGTFLSRKINWALSNATDATVDGAGALVVTRPDLGAGSPITIAAADGNMTLARGAAAAEALNAPIMTVSDVTFTVDPANGGRPPSVTAMFSVRGIPFTYKKFLRQ